MLKKDLEYYMSLHYPTLIEWVDEDQMYSVSVPLLSGLAVYDAQLTDALSELKEAKREWLSTAIDRGITIPEPQPKSVPASGRVTLRMPKTLHQLLIANAAADNVSLNSYLLLAIQRGVDVDAVNRVRKNHPVTINSSVSRSKDNSRSKSAPRTTSRAHLKVKGHTQVKTQV